MILLVCWCQNLSIRFKPSFTSSTSWILTTITTYWAISNCLCNTNWIMHAKQWKKISWRIRCPWLPSKTTSCFDDMLHIECRVYAFNQPERNNNVVWQVQGKLSTWLVYRQWFKSMAAIHCMSCITIWEVPCWYYICVQTLIEDRFRARSVSRSRIHSVHTWSNICLLGFHFLNHTSLFLDDNTIDLPSLVIICTSATSIWYHQSFPNKSQNNSIWWTCGRQ